MIYLKRIFYFINKILLIALLSIKYTYADIVFEKNDIVITSIELELYLDFLNQKNINTNYNDAKKNIYLIKKAINKLKMNNSIWVTQVNENLLKNINGYNQYPSIIKNLFIFDALKNELINEYFVNELNVDDVQQAISSIDNTLYPISENGCLTIIKTISLKDNYYFIEGVYDLLKSKKDTLILEINNKKYQVCINAKNQKFIEENVYQLIAEKIQYKINDFVYGK
jgi:hypothetical protein